MPATAKAPAKTKASAPVDDDIDTGADDDIDGIDADDDLDDSTDDSGGGDTEVPSPPPAASWRDLAKDKGLDLSSYEDDGAALDYILQQQESARREAEQSRQLAQYGQQFLPYASEFQAFMAQRQQAAQQEAAADPYARPEWNPAWEALLTTAEDGRIVPNERLGGSPDIVQKYHKIQEWRRGFLNEPEKYLEKYIQQQAAEQAQSIVNQQLTAMRRQIAAEMFVANPANSFLFEDTASGRQLSEDGKYFSSKLQLASQRGWSDDVQQQYAMDLLAERRAARASTNGNGNGKPKTKADKNRDFLRATAQGAQPSASTAPVLRDDDAPQNENHSWAQLAREAFKRAGISETDELVD